MNVPQSILSNTIEEIERYVAHLFFMHIETTMLENIPRYSGIFFDFHTSCVFQCKMQSLLIILFTSESTFPI